MSLNKREHEILFSEKSPTELDLLWKFYRSESERYFRLDEELMKTFCFMSLSSVGFLLFGLITQLGIFVLNGAVTLLFALPFLLASLYAQHRDIHYSILGDIAFDTNKDRNSNSTDD